MVYIKQNSKPIFKIGEIIEGQQYDENHGAITSRAHLKHEAKVLSKTLGDKRARALYDELYKNL